MTLLGEAVAPSFQALKGKLGGSSRSSKLYILCTHTTLMGCLNKFWMGIKQIFFFEKLQEKKRFSLDSSSSGLTSI